MKKLSLFVSLLLVFLMLASCSDTVSFKNEGGNIVDKKNGITYICAPMCIEPIATELDIYGECKELKIQLYGIIGCDTALWLSEKYNGIGSVYYAEGKVTIPTLADFGAHKLTVCEEVGITMAVANVEDADAVTRVVEAFEKGETVKRAPEGKRYSLKFESDGYKGIYYSLEYIDGYDGENYIFDREAKRCVNVGDVLTEYMPGGAS